MKQKIQKFLKLREDKRFQPIFDVAIFTIILFSVHYAFIWWEIAGYPPIKNLVDQLFISASSILFDQSVWVVEHLFRMEYTTQGHNILFVTSDGTNGYVGVEPGCTSLKQWIHWIVLMLLFPGPWKHKLWYIPAGTVVIHIVNLIRVTGLVVTTSVWPQSFEFFHNYIFKTFFYFMIFIMWAVWVEFFSHKERKVVKHM